MEQFKSSANLHLVLESFSPAEDFPEHERIKG